MTKRVALATTIVGVLALLTVGGALALRSGGPVDPAPTTSARGEPAPGAAAAATRPAVPSVSVSEAVKALNLIRPSRQKMARDFSASMPGGGTFRLAQHRGKVVFVNFWATWCPPCREEMPAMERLWRRHKDDGFLMIAVSVDADPSLVQPFLETHALTFPVALDPKMEVASLYGVRALPSSYILDREGNMAALALGPRAWDQEAAHALIEGMTRR